ncbi:maleylpyruvate isomerase family mycothiol-dependent enzyme [Actinoplanes sp. NPDC024001]|uniref:maleylpyruvate isomerase family mycothiol-dependent enzyme n=1 Tax=Actinoplanes sp. NPDC024001 TaxID=3154598 RepID=UPI0033ED555A
MTYSDLLRLIDERATAFRAAVAAAPDLGAQVPTCPEWTLFDLAEHIGEGRRRWAATVAAGPADAPPDRAAWPGPLEAPRERDALLDWLTASTQLLVGALREAGPDRGCWTWWGRSQSPRNSAAVARHQLQQLAVHTYDAQLVVGAAEPLPTEIALDGVDEFLSTCCATTSPWPHEPATVDYHATEGRSWRLSLSADGARSARTNGEGTADASAEGSASELVLFLYGRILMDALKLEGDRRQFDRLIAWDPGV